MKKSFTVRSEEELPAVARELLALSEERRIFALYGEMGAGKSTLIKAFCRVLEVNDTVSSPSFAIVHEYRRPSGEAVHHVDLYRLGDEEELYDLGFEDILEEPGYCFIEWPEKAGNFLPSDPVRLDIEISEEAERRIRIRT